jgi:ATP-dependent exoDNAse (exonuclease V) alpha subunit
MLIARTNAQVRALNAEMRKHLRENDVIGGREVTISTENASGQKEKLTLARGDQIRFLVRNDRLAVINGSIGRIRHVTQDADGHARIIANVDGETVRFSTRDLAGKTGGAKLAHAYASTLYSSQGATVDAAFLVVDPAWTRNDIYVGISRARDAAQVFLDRRSVDVQIKADAPLSDRRQMSINDEQRFGRIVTALSREATKVSTLDWRPGVDAQQTTAESSPARLSRNRDLTPER